MRLARTRSLCKKPGRLLQLGYRIGGGAGNVTWYRPGKVTSAGFGQVKRAPRRGHQRVTIDYSRLRPGGPIELFTGGRRPEVVRDVAYWPCFLDARLAMGNVFP